MKDFRYDLPDEAIARYPQADRSSSKLLVVLPGAEGQAKLLDKVFVELPTMLPPNAHLVLNETRVFTARLFATTAEGKTEVMFLSPEGDGSAPDASGIADPAAALGKPCEGQFWRCMIRSSSAGPGTVLDAGPSLKLRVERICSQWHEEGLPDGVEAVVRLSPSQDVTAAEVFEALGSVPLPPYLCRESESSDKEAYQTVFAAANGAGSVAAPTAGLHFTQAMLEQLESTGTPVTRLQLHVGAGTFRPVVSDNISEHDMHAEPFSISVAAVKSLLRSLEEGRPLIPVGTTTVRALESLYWISVKDAKAKEPSRAPGGIVEQWEAYQLAAQGSLPTAAEALRHLALRAEAAGATAVRGLTRMCIVPGYKFKLCDALVTNFHQPDSTLMLLVSALAGSDQIKLAYEHAKTQGYRFLSYGDASMIFNPESSNMNVVSFRQSQESRPSPGEKVLLHSCCAPCSGAMIEEMHTQGLDVTIFFYNPNIHPRKEYEIRKNENKRFAEQLGIPFVDCDYDVDEWYRRAKGMEFCPERGTRCTMCFDMRFERTAHYAWENGFPWITTTNATSRWKDAQQVNGSGLRSVTKYPGVKYWVYDWQTQTMTDRKYHINAANRFYKQEYCGCSYSLRDSNTYRKKNGMPPVSIGGDSFYEDPEADAAEESEEVVKSFFQDAQREEELRSTYGGRRRGLAGKGDENW